jgi:hypothetical protein
MQREKVYKLSKDEIKNECVLSQKKISFTHGRSLITQNLNILKNKKYNYRISFLK